MLNVPPGRQSGSVGRRAPTGGRRVGRGRVGSVGRVGPTSMRRAPEVARGSVGRLGRSRVVSSMVSSYRWQSSCNIKCNAVLCTLHISRDQRCSHMCFSLKSIVTHANSQTAASSALTVEDPAHAIRSFELYVPTRGGVAERPCCQKLVEREHGPWLQNRWWHHPIVPRVIPVTECNRRTLFKGVRS